MFSYYGSKSKVVHLYPRPEYDKIIEPFAGSARYSLRYFDRDVLLVDKYEVIVRIWKYLQQCSPQDILKLPRPKQNNHLSEYTFDCDEAKWLMGFLIKKAVDRPALKPSFRATTHRPNNINFQLNFIAKNLFKIRHWSIVEGDYKDIPNENATWFIDPPYQKGGHSYVMSNKYLDFGGLAMWCHLRLGQAIVCENMSASWLPFLPMARMKGTHGITTEAIWTNRPTHYETQQMVMSLG